MIFPNTASWRHPDIGAVKLGLSLLTIMHLVLFLLSTISSATQYKTPSVFKKQRNLLQSIIEP